MAALFYLPTRPAFTPNGIVAPGSLLYFYATGTLTPQTVYADAALIIALPHPVKANSAGLWPSIYLNDALIYRLRIDYGDGSPLDQFDPYLPGQAEKGAPGDRGQSGATGAPGGNERSAGLFTSLNGIVLAPGVDVVESSGATTVGIGRAGYTVLPGRTLEGQGGISRFTAADGRVLGLPLREPVSIDAMPAAELGAKLGQAFGTLSVAGRTSTTGHPGWGVGLNKLPKGNFAMSSTFTPQSPLGWALEGASRYASAIEFSQVNGIAFNFGAYVGVRLADFTLQAVGAAIGGGSIGVSFYSAGGGGFASLKNVDILNFDTCIRNSFTADGDKTLIETCNLVGGYGYDNTNNKQAISWTFLGCSGFQDKSRFRLGGAGMNLILNDVPNLGGSFISYPEGSGNPGKQYWPGGTCVVGTKIEQHGTGTEPGSNLLVDAGASRGLSDSGGSNVDLMFLDTHITGSDTEVPLPDTKDIIVVGSAGQGSDSISIKAFGGWMRGVIRYSSQLFARSERRWLFMQQRRSPLPESAQLLGPGFHPLMEWRANENVPVDQYIGGQSFVGAVAAEKGLLWHDEGDRLMTSVGGLPTSVTPTVAGVVRYGQMFAINVFPPECCFTGLGVVVTGNASNSDTLVEWFADAAATSLIGQMTVPGPHRGLFRMRDAQITGVLPRGSTLYVRMTKVAVGQTVTGAVVPFYFPWMARAA